MKWNFLPLSQGSKLKEIHPPGSPFCSPERAVPLVISLIQRVVIFVE